MEFEGKRALVTGGSRGIGKAIAEALIRRGATVVITGRDQGVLEKAAAELGATGMQGDVSKESDCTRVVAESIDAMGGLDILINNAGVGGGAPLVEMTAEIMHKVISINVLGAMLMGREAARHFVKQERGAIVNISSTAGLKGMPRGTAYCASKFALRGMTECWRAELRPHNIQVMLVNPSEVQTEWGGRKLDTINPKKLLPEDIADAVIGALEINERGFVPEFAVFATNPF